MLIYFDTCCLQRPFDNRLQPRINIEAEAVLTVLGLIEQNYVTLVSSEILDYEISKIPDLNRRDQTRNILNLSNQYIHLSDKIELQAKYFVQNHIKPLDALHLAAAIEGNADFFCTTDDKFLKKN